MAIPFWLTAMTYSQTATSQTASRKALIIVATLVLLGCTFACSDTDQAAQPGIQLHAVKQTDILDAMRVALESTIRALGHDVLRHDQIVIRSDYMPPQRDPLTEHGLNGAALTRRLATAMGYAVLPHAAVVVCDRSFGADTSHGCQLTFDGAYYLPTIESFPKNAPLSLFISRHEHRTMLQGPVCSISFEPAIVGMW
jgi:hypothetical protein